MYDGQRFVPEVNDAICVEMTAWFCSWYFDIFVFLFVRKMQDSHILLDNLPRLVWRNVADSRMNHRNLNWRYWHGRDRKCRPCLVVRIERFAELIKESLDKFSSFSMSNINLCKSIQFLCASFVGGCKEEQLDFSLPYVWIGPSFARKRRDVSGWQFLFWNMPSVMRWLLPQQLPMHPFLQKSMMSSSRWSSESCFFGSWIKNTI